MQDFTEYDSAILTAENCGNAYRALALPSYTVDSKSHSRSLCINEIKRFHPTLNAQERLRVANQVVNQWIAYYNN